MIRRSLFATAGLAVALLVAACSGSASSPSAAPVATPSPSAVASPSEVASASEIASASASASELPSTGASASEPNPLASGIPGLAMHAAPDLEAMLPASISGHTLTKASFAMAQLGALSGGSSDQTFANWVKALGKNPSDVNMAIGFDTGSDIQIGAIQVKGADQSQLLSSFIAAAQQGSMTTTQTSLGGKQVVKVVDTSTSNNQITYIYPKNDVLFFANAPDDATAGAAISALP